MTATTLTFDKVIHGCFYIPSQIGGDQFGRLRAAFPTAESITRENVETLVPPILGDWNPSRLRKSMNRARAMFDRADVAANPPAMSSEKDICKRLGHSMTITVTPKRLAKLLYTRRGPNLEIAYEYDDGSAMRDPHIPTAYIRDFTLLGGSRDAFIVWLEERGARPERRTR